MGKTFVGKGTYGEYCQVFVTLSEAEIVITSVLLNLYTMRGVIVICHRRGKNVRLTIIVVFSGSSSIA